MGSTAESGGLSILVVSADESFATSCGTALQSHLGGDVVAASTVERALELLQSDEPVDCIISDHDLPEMDGVAFLETVRVQYPVLPFILFTSEGDEAVASRAISADVTEYLIKGRHSTQWERLATLIDDAVEYHENRRELVDRETRTQTLLDAVRDTIAVVQDGTLAYVNRSGFELLQCDDRQSVVGCAVEDVFPVVAPFSLGELVEDVQRGVTFVERTDVTLARPTGDTLPIELTATRVEWGTQPAVALVVRDVGDKRSYKTELEQFKRAVEAAGHAIYITETDGTITYVNPAFERITGYEKADAVGHTPELLNSGEMSDEYYERLWGTISEGAVWEEEIINRRQSGETYHANQTVAPILDADSDVQQFVAIQTDITEQKELERELKRREDDLRQYERAISGATDLIAATDRDERYLFANPQYCAYHGVEQDEITDRTLEELVDTDTYAEVQSQLDRVLQGQTVRYRTTRSHPRKGDRTLDVRYYPLREGDEVTGVVGVMRDVTDTASRSVQLRVVDRVLRHNLRNDLTAIRLRAEQLRLATAPDQEELVETMLRKIDGLLTTSEKSRRITDILADQPQRTAVPLTERVQQLVSRIGDQFPDAKLTVAASGPAVASATVDIDQAVEELVTNAIVHHDGESPSVEIHLMQNDNSVVVRVTDDGSGIPSMDRDVLERGRTSDELYHGSGLGLWLVYWIVRRSGGTITVSDAEPRGTEVTIRLSRHE